MRRLVLACSILALCVPALALADGGPHAKTLTGTITANPSGSVTVASGTAILTCTVPSRAVTSVAKLKIGTHVKIACRATGNDALVLTGIQPITSRDDHHQSQGNPGQGNTGQGNTGQGNTSQTTSTPTTTTPHTGDNGQGTGTGTGTTTTKAPPPPPPPTTTPQRREAIGIVFFHSSTGVAVRPDKGGEVLTCAITTAPDSAAAAAKLTLNGHFGVVCRLDGTHWVLSGATPAP
jgi:hypothetical protein